MSDPLLTRKVTRSLIAGHAPQIRVEIEGSQPCPFGVGQELHVADNLSIKVTRIQAKAGEWRITYLLRDFRPRLLGKTGVAYTHSSVAAIKARHQSAEGFKRTHDEPEAVPDEWEDRGVAQRETRRQEAQRTAAREKRESDARAAIGRTLKGLDSDASIALLVKIQRLCEAETRGALKDAA